MPPVPVKPLGTSPQEAVLVTTWCWRDQGQPVQFHWERALGSLCLISPDFTPFNMSLCQFCFEHFCLEDYLSPESPTNKLLKPRHGLGTPDMTPPT